MNKRITSTIHKLDKKAKNNSWEAAYQLYEYYLEGKYVEQDYETAQFYIDLATKNIESTYVYLEDISLLEFRALNELTLNFPEKNLTVLAGENGVGKSSVLDGLSYSLSWLVNRILYKGGKGKEIERLDIRDDSTRGYSSIIIKLAINRFAKANLELCELHVGSSANKKSHLNEISKLGALYKFAGENDASFTLPIFAHYGVSRTIDISTKDLSTIDDVNLLQINNRFEAYVNSFSGKADIKSFLKWFKRLDDIEKHRIVSSENLPTDDDLINKLAILAINDLNARKLLESLKSKEKKNEEWLEKMRELKALNVEDTSETGELTPEFLFRKLSELDDGSFVLTTEVGQHQMWASQHFKFKTPRTFISSGGLGTMGYGLGASIGAQMALKDKQVINIAGDGSFGMNCNELATAAKNNLPIIVIILNNNSLGMVRQWQNFFYEGRYSSTTLNRTTDFVKVAEAFGGKGYRVFEKEELVPVLKEALEYKGPVVIDYVIENDKKVFPMVAPGAPINEIISEEDV